MQHPIRHCTVIEDDEEATTLVALHSCYLLIDVEEMPQMIFDLHKAIGMASCHPLL
jgi:hypothetical protein